MNVHRARPASVLALALALAATALADGGPNHQISSDSFGVSGGNLNDRTRRFCCSGTLGSLVADSDGALYVLSNNHVLARRGKASAGEDISQPGLIDSGCAVTEVVADLSAFAPLGSNVDAAIAELRPGAMSADGSILDVGIPSSVTAAPAIGMPVAKSGRTTGFTTATIALVNASVNVRYQQNCGSGRQFIVGYTNQVVISSNTFSAGGDSGSLIVTNDASHNPVALLYAGSSTSTIGNPIGEVLTKVGGALGRPVSFNLAGSAAIASSIVPTVGDDEVSRATRAKDAHAGRLMSDPAVVAVGVGEDSGQPGRAAVVILVERGRGRAQIARQLDGVPTRVVETDPIVAFGWNERDGASCQPK